MTITDKKNKDLHTQFLTEFDEEAAGQTWGQQSQEFREFWNEVLRSDEKLNPEDFDYYIRFLDSHAKGIADSDIEPSGRSLIPQGSWRRIMQEFKKNKRLQMK